MKRKEGRPFLPARMRGAVLLPLLFAFQAAYVPFHLADAHLLPGAVGDSHPLAPSSHSEHPHEHGGSGHHPHPAIEHEVDVVPARTQQVLFVDLAQPNPPIVALEPGYALSIRPAADAQPPPSPVPRPQSARAPPTA